MEFMKVLDQTVRELKREVNKTILKVPEIEQKVLDATSNEPWGPHGSVMAEIAQATRNYYELQMIMAILWKRLSDTGRNWRHVYKTLTVLEYLVAHGAERVIDDIREHTYQITILADFQYVEPNGRDQGINVRKKSQSLMLLVNDKEKIREVRQKAADNKDKYRGISSMGGMSRPISYQSTEGRYGDDRYEHNDGRYGIRDDDSYSRERDDDHYARNNEHSSRYNDRHQNRDYDDADYYSSHKGDYYSGKQRGLGDESDRAHKDMDHQSSRIPIQKASTTAGTSSPPGYEEASQSPDHHMAENGREMKSFAGQSVKASSANDISDDFDDFNPRAIPVAAPSQFDELFNQPEPAPAPVISMSAPPPVSPNFFGDTNNFFGDTSSSSVTSALSQKLREEDLFGNSLFDVKDSGSTVSTAAQAAIKPPPNYAPPSLDTGNGVKGSVFPASIKPPPTFSTGNAVAPVGVATFDAFASHASSTSQASTPLFGGDDFFGLDTSRNTPQPAFSANVLVPPQAAISGGFQTSQSLFGTASQEQLGNSKPQHEKPFETKSSVWADSLSKGLIDLNISGPKSNPLPDIGVNFDQLRTEGIKDERMSTGKSTSGMGKAMGPGSGLGVAGANALVRPAGPMTMNRIGMTPTLGMGMNMGLGPLMQMGLNPGQTVRPGVGIGASASATSGPAGIGVGINSSFGSFPNQQQQYGGYR